MTAVVTQNKLLSMQVCVPADWTNEQIVEFANRENPTGISSNWKMRCEGHKLLNGAPERVRCLEYPDNVHVMLDC